LEEIREAVESIMRREKLDHTNLERVSGIGRDTIGRFIRGDTKKLGRKNILKLQDKFPQYFASIRTVSAGLAAPRVAKMNHQQIRSMVARSLPIIEEGIYEVFHVHGNSMIPTFYNGDMIIARQLADPKEVRNDYVHIIVTNRGDLNDFFHSSVIKRVSYRAKTGMLYCRSDNKDSEEPFNTFQLDCEMEVEELWRPVLKISSEMSNPNRNLFDRVIELENRIDDLETQFSN
jgi:hypothetical protein